MREVDIKEIQRAVRAMALESSWLLGEAEQSALRRLAQEEESPAGRHILQALIENFVLAAREQRPLCQDTGLAVVFLELGQDVHLTGGRLDEAVNQGVREAHREGLLRASVLNDPLLRRNTGDNTPAVIHTEIVPGDQVRVLFDAKGGGCENCSQFRMLKPAEGRAGIVRFVTQVIVESGGNPCPPVVVGVGLGGTFERAAWLAKRALFRPLGQAHPQPHLAALETELLEAVDRTGVGPLGLGGTHTALAVHVEAAPCHLTSLPVAVNLDCHSHRHREVVI